jgi:hypothetical protein
MAARLGIDARANLSLTLNRPATVWALSVNQALTEPLQSILYRLLMRLGFLTSREDAQGTWRCWPLVVLKARKARQRKGVIWRIKERVVLHPSPASLAHRAVEVLAPLHVVLNAVFSRFSLHPKSLPNHTSALSTRASSTTRSPASRLTTPSPLWT